MYSALALLASASAIKLQSKAQHGPDFSNLLQAKQDCDPTTRDATSALWYMSNHDKDGKVTTDEFIATLDWLEANHEEFLGHMDAGFKKVDADGNGVATTKEMRKFVKAEGLKGYDRRAAWAFFKAFDLNKDGKVSWTDEAVPAFTYVADNWGEIRPWLEEGFAHAAGDDGDLTLKELYTALGCTK